MKKSLLSFYNKLPLPHKRRQSLLSQMANLFAQGVNCFACKGLCCTFSSNSMQISFVEGLDLYFFLKNNQLLDQKLINGLEKNISRFNLNRNSIGDGKRVFSRFYYTCPFFCEDSFVCKIKKQNKPYGCLAFNPQFIETKNGKGCKSNIKILQERESHEESKINESIKKITKLDYHKAPIPIVLLDLIKILDTK